LKAVLLDDTDDTPSADREASLAELLRDDVDRSVGIEEAVTDDLANEFVRADIVVLGAGLVALESCASLFPIEFEELKIALLAEVELRSGLDGTEPFALAFNKHGEAGDDVVIRKNGKVSGGADDAEGRHVELHRLILRERAWGEEAGSAIGTLAG
jgi:hypothetical protein